MKIGVLCGAGQLPIDIIHACQERNLPFYSVAFIGQTPSSTAGLGDHGWFALGALKKIITALKRQGVTHVVLAGSLQRPSWKELGLDIMGVTWLAKAGLKSLGDDGLLCAALGLLRDQGFEILQPGYFVQSLLCPEGILSVTLPSDQEWQDIDRGRDVLKCLSPADVGQGIVVQGGIVLAIEAIEGTQAMIERAGTLQRSGGPGVFVKMAKAGQSTDVDLPSIGPETAHQLKKAGLRGAALSAHTTQLIERDKTIQLFNDYELFLVGIKACSPIKDPAQKGDIHHF